MATVRELTPQELTRYADGVRAILAEIQGLPVVDPVRLHSILRRHPRDGNSVFNKNQIIATYRHLCTTGQMQFDGELLRRLQMKPVRTLSGVTPVTVLTKPFPCPGKCIFCPTDVRMPKSYLHDEPGAMRAEQYAFDPYDQTASRMRVFDGNGHGTDKIELLVLGGTWSSYPRDYQEWFLRRCFDAMNGFNSPTLARAHAGNETSRHRNVGLVLETRPDHVTPEEVRWLRSLGATKIQMGAQSLDDRILRLNHRGHTVEQTRQAMTLLRAAGFKLVLHWMPNLHGATPQSDREDFQRLWDDESLRPDEIKLYSTILLENAQLYDVWRKGHYQPYDEEDLLELMVDCKTRVPRYCRINRLYRDIPSTNVVAGSKMTNMRQAVQQRMAQRSLTCWCIRCREVKGRSVDAGRLRRADDVYRTSASEEHFLSYLDPDDRLAGYLRLSLPDEPGRPGGVDLGLPELSGAALVREVHVYGPALDLGSREGTQHQGLGTQLLDDAATQACDRGYARLAIIASVGTRPYYASRGFRLDGTYMVKELS